MGIIDHVSIAVPPARLAEIKNFYIDALAPLGVEKLMDYQVAIGFGKGESPDFWLGERDPAPTEGVHVAFTANDRASVRAFYDAAIKAGATCNGKPGVRDEYDPNYYAAFVVDPIGNRIEAVCLCPEQAEEKTS